MSNNKKITAAALPVLFGFFVMGFCDLVGIATSYVKDSFNWSESMAGFVPSMVFIWFFILSVPVAVWMNKIGRKNTVHASNIITFVGMLLPVIFGFNPATCLIAFALLGIGNTMLQVSVNPLLTNVVSGDALTSSLTLGQVVKSICSFCGPLIVSFLAMRYGRWELIFPVFAVITLISEIWLRLTPIKREEPSKGSASFASAISLLGDKKVLLLFLGIFFVVGIDVGTNTVAPKLLIERCGLETTSAAVALGSTIYFICKTIGNFVGTFMLLKFKDSTYYKINIFLTCLVLIALLFVSGQAGIYVLIAGIGLFVSCIFSLIYSTAIKANKGKENAISGLMIMGVSGGAVIPPLMGIMTQAIGSQVGSIIVLGICAAYLVFCAYYCAKLEAKIPAADAPADEVPAAEAPVEAAPASEE